MQTYLKSMRDDEDIEFRKEKNKWEYRANQDDVEEADKVQDNYLINDKVQEGQCLIKQLKQFYELGYLNDKGKDKFIELLENI